MWTWLERYNVQGRSLRAKGRLWDFYFLEEHPGTELPVSVLRSLLSADRLESTSAVGFARDAAFFYVGHGDLEGVFSSDGFNFGLRQRLVEPQQVGAWRATPQIWWCCFSARWLSKLERRDWIGFNEYTGHDGRGGQKKWWRKWLTEIIATMLAAAEGRASADSIRLKADEMYQEALRYYRDAKKLSYATVLISRLFSESLIIGKDFGGRK